MYVYKLSEEREHSYQENAALFHSGRSTLQQHHWKTGAKMYKIYYSLTNKANLLVIVYTCCNSKHICHAGGKGPL